MSWTTADFHIFRPRNVHLLRRWRGGQQRTNWMVDCWGRILRGELSPLVSRWADQRGRSIMKTWRPSPFPSLPPSFPKHPLHGWYFDYPQLINIPNRFRDTIHGASKLLTLTGPRGRLPETGWQWRGYMSWYQVDLHVLQKDAAQDPWGLVGRRWGWFAEASGHAMAASFWSILIYSAVLITWFQLQFSIDSIDSKMIIWFFPRLTPTTLAAWQPLAPPAL